MDQSVALISEAKAAVQDPNAPNKQVRLAQAAKAVSQALNQVVNCLPGQIEFDHAIKAIAEASRRLQTGKVGFVYCFFPGSFSVFRVVSVFGCFRRF